MTTLPQNIAIQVSHLTKIFYNSVKESGYAKSPIASSQKRIGGPHSFVALDDLSFDLQQGEVLGIIGRNGSGKSTLLKILSEVIPPTSGIIKIQGEVASLLEVGIGFHPDITGRENIFISGILLGMDKATIKSKFDEIVHFSGIGEFIDMPVKKYSSGMFLRLAFAVMISLDNSILLLDEILSVGDADFRLKSYNKIKSMRGSNKTIIIVSHDLNSISDLCTKCLVLDKGRMVQYGDTDAIISNYMEKAMAEYLDAKETENGHTHLKGQSEMTSRRYSTARDHNNIGQNGFLDAAGNSQFRLLEISVAASGKANGEPIMMNDNIEISYTYEKDFEEKTVPGILIASPLWGTVMALSSERVAPDSDYCTDEGVGIFISKCTLPASFLNAGLYTVIIYFNLADEMDTLIMNIEDVLTFKVNYLAYKVHPSEFIYKGRFRGPIYPLSNWKISTKPTVHL